MKTPLLRSLILCGGIVLVNGCEVEDPGDISLRNEYLGTWNVNEKDGIDSPQFYTVAIVKGASEDEIIIEGLYNIPMTEVKARVNGFNFSLPSQFSENITFEGSGQANADFDQLSLDFVAHDGSVFDTVKAVFIR